MGNSNGNRFPVLASDKFPSSQNAPTRQNGVLWVVEKTTNEVYITKYPKRDRWFTNLSNQAKTLRQKEAGARAEA
jgi:hypothetical protein